jgi:5-(carboxyamino)imidazole ribonucleotide mutase
MLAIIIMGSPADREFSGEIAAALDTYGIRWQMRIASAHKTPQALLDLLAEYEADGEPKVYVTVAGRSNALSGMVDAAVAAPVIACPPYSTTFGGGDIYSSLRTPSGVAPAVVLEPKNAALLAAKVLGLHDADLRQKVVAFQTEQRQRLLDADREPQ